MQASEIIEVGDVRFLYRNQFDRKVIAEVVERDVYNVSYIPVGSVVVDIGAHIGSFCIKCACERDCMVYAYEPLVDTFRMLRENITLNEVEDKVRMFRMAVVGTPDTLRHIYYGNEHFEETSFLLRKDKVEVVSCTRLADIFLENNISDCIVKMDCEGAELEIVMTSSFDNVHKIIMETHWNFHKVILDFLRAKGFYADFKRTAAERGMLIATR